MIVSDPNIKKTTMCNKCDQVVAWKDYVWRLKIINFPWTDKYAAEHSWAWTCMQASSYCDSYLCKIVNTEPAVSSIKGDCDITHHWISVEMLSGPKQGDTIIIAKAWLANLEYVPEPKTKQAKKKDRTLVSPKQMNWGDSMKRYNDNRPKKEYSSSQSLEKITVFDSLSTFLCIIPGAPLPILVLNMFGPDQNFLPRLTSYEASWVMYSCVSIALLQYIGIGIAIYLYLNLACAVIFACCLIPFYLNFGLASVRLYKETKKIK